MVYEMGLLVVNVEILLHSNLLSEKYGLRYDSIVYDSIFFSKERHFLQQTVRIACFRFLIFV